MDVPGAALTTVPLQVLRAVRFLSGDAFALDALQTAGAVHSNMIGKRFQFENCVAKKFTARMI